MTKAEIISAVTTVFERPIKWINWLGVPKDHRILTYCESNIKFEGADYYAMRKSYILDIFIFYRGNVNDEDFACEREFERMCAPMGHFLKENGYQGADSLFYAHYMFDINEDVAKE